MHAHVPTRVPAITSSEPSGTRQFGRVLWRQRVLMLLVVLVVAGSVALGLASASRQYSAFARVAATPPATATQSPASYTDILGTLADVASSRPILTLASRQLGNRSVAQLASSVTSAVVPGTLIIQISVTDRDPVMAAKIANTIASDLPAEDPTHGELVVTRTDPAVVPGSFSSPNIKITSLAALVLALSLAVAVAVIYDKIARTVESAADANEAAGIGTLGVLPRPDDVHGLPAVDSASREYAALRALRVALEFASSEHPTRSLVVAPVVADPWNGWLEVNLAVALAEVGHRVLLIDANRNQRATRHPILEADGQTGLYELLAGETFFEQAAIPGPVEGVTIIPLGNPDLAAPTLLEMRFRHLLDSIDSSYDVILVHAAPVTESDDARIMAIDGSLLLTVPSRRVKPAVLHRAAEGLRAVRTRILGAVLVGGRAHRHGPDA